MPDKDNEMDFDEKKEIEKLQATIRSMSNFSDDSEGFLSQSPRALMGDSALGSIADAEQKDDEEYDPYAILERPVAKQKGPRAKKFVVMVDSENVEFFDKIPMEERTKLFNTLLTEYKNNLDINNKKKKAIKYTKHLIVSVLTILISLPIMFIVVKKSIQLTIKNYKDVQYNFEKLYESKNQNRFTDVHRTIY